MDLRREGNGMKPKTRWHHAENVMPLRCKRTKCAFMKAVGWGEMVPIVAYNHPLALWNTLPPKVKIR